jgi:serine/threonine protein kinase
MSATPPGDHNGDPQKPSSRSREGGLVDPPDGVRTTDELKTRHSDDRRPMLNQYLYKAQVGHGQHGEVILCWDVTKKRNVAIKAVKRSSREDKTLRKPKRLPSSVHTPYADKIGVTEHKIRKEIAIMKKCRHGNVVRLLEVIDDRLKSKIYMG